MNHYFMRDQRRPIERPSIIPFLVVLLLLFMCGAVFANEQRRGDHNYHVKTKDRNFSLHYVVEFTPKSNTDLFCIAKAYSEVPINCYPKNNNKKQNASPSATYNR